ncbi:aminotransferase class V-fold PLP-dependent enzyme [Silvanigrella paludirubra]|nr:aminotransferase class V-fold PLP-dependent enzyme [Silvanigrella paludirubra]
MNDSFHNSNRIYFDCNATTPILKDACQAVLCTMEKVYGNPSSTHMAGAEAKMILERARIFASEVIQAKPSEIFFTSGATEAIQISVLSLLQWISAQKKLGTNFENKKILISATEHKAVPNAVEHWCKVLGLDIEIITIPVNEKGHLNLNVIEEHAQETIFLCTMAVNNETGLITNLKNIEKIIRKQAHHIYWLVDSVQALGKIDLKLSELSIDYATFSGHKIHAPKGIGFLYLRENAPQCPLIVGGGQEQGVRSGTENLPGIAAIGVVLEKLNQRKKGIESSQLRSEKELFEFRNILLNALNEAFPSIEFNTDLEESVPTTLNFSIYGLLSKEIMNAFDAAGISISGGSACNSKSIEYSHVLCAMNLPEWKKASGVRLSFSMMTTKNEILNGVQAILAAGKAFRNSCLNLSCSIENNNLDKIPDKSSFHGVIQFQYDYSNTWLLVDSNTKNCIIIDPTIESMDRIASFIQCRNLSVQAVLDTHSHADHESSRKKLLNKLNLIDNSNDILGWPGDENILLFNSNEWEIERLGTPGHTKDSVSYLVYNKTNEEKLEFVFVGDTILTGGLGRTDFGISAVNQFYNTLHLLNKKFDDNVLLCPAHDYNNSFATTWGVEKNTNKLLEKAINPFNVMSLNEFCEEKKLIDSELCSNKVQGKIICGLIQSSVHIEDKSEPTINPEKLNNEDFILIDIRDKTESLLFKDWNIFGIEFEPISIPMIQITNLMIDLLQKKSNFLNKKIVLLCSTGNRSLYIAKSFRRMGFQNVWSINGGVAFSRLRSDEKLNNDF